MEMRVSEEVGIGEDITTPLSPLASALYDSSLLSHCSSCFSPLSPSSSPPNSHHVPSLLYCSPRCSAAASSASAAEHHLLLLRRSQLLHRYADDTADIRAAFHLLRLFHTRRLPLNGDRAAGLLTNRGKLISRRSSESGDSDEVIDRIREGAKAMAVARSLRDGVEFSGESGLEEEEMALCIVLANAVEVQSDGGPGIGIAVYDTTFSWINHSCSPNACYRFQTASPEAEMLPFAGDLGLRITPGGQYNVNAFSRHDELRKGWEKYGPRIVVRSIKPIKKGEEVTIAYTDLLQPKAMRQSELWLKYRFICCCKRCSALPSTYADNALEEIAAAHHSPSSDFNFYKNEAVRILADHIDEAISEYLFASDPESCCMKLENILMHGTLYEQLDPKIGKSKLNFRLHPLHRLALNAYTTLSSAYKTCAGNLLSANPKNHNRQSDAFNMLRTSAAYSLFLAVATHRLFLSESSLITSVANFWTDAGESLLSLARSSFWDSSIKWDSPLPGHDCCNCLLMDRFGANLAFARAEYAGFEDISKDFLTCIAKIVSEVWGFLAYNCHYLKLFKDPTDFRWLRQMADGPFSGGCNGFGVSCGGWYGYTKKERKNLCKLGFHCSIYGGYLLSICFGGHSYWIAKVQTILCSEEKT